MQGTTTDATPSVFAGTWTIARARWQIARNTFWRGRLSRKLLTVAVVVTSVAISYGLYRFSGFVVRGLRFLAEQEETRDLIAEIGSLDRIFAAVPSLTLAVFALPMLLGSVSFALSTLYLARDLEALLVTPVPVRSVFLARFLEGLAPTYLLLFVVLAPALVGYGQALGYGAVFLLTLALVLLLLPLLPVSVGTLLTMLLVRFIPAKRLRDVLTVVGALFGLLVYVGSQSLNRFTSDLATPETAEQLLRFDLPLLPTSWGARALIAAGEGQLAVLLAYGALYFVATAGLFAVCIAMAERLYLNGLVSIASSGNGRTRQRRSGAAPALLLRGPAGAIVRKDLRILPRDLQQLTQLLFPLAIAGFWIWRLLTDTDATGPDLGASGLTTGTSLVITGIFVCLLVSSHLGLTGLSREGRSFWLLQLAPINAWTIVWAKWLVAWLPFAVLGTLFVAGIGIFQRPSLGELARSWLIFALTGAGVAGITAGFGAAFPRFDWQQPKKMTTARASCLGSLLYFCYTGLMLAATTGPHFAAARFGNWIHAAGWSVAVLLTALAVSLPLWLGASRLRRQEL